MSKRIVVCCDGTWNTPDQKDDGVVCHDQRDQARHGRGAVCRGRQAAVALL